MKFLARLPLLWHYLWMAYDKWKTDGEPTWQMARYSEDISEHGNWYPLLTRIEVADERTKEELIEAFRYIHDGDVDTDFKAINLLTHLYVVPELIVVKPHTKEGLAELAAACANGCQAKLQAQGA